MQGNDNCTKCGDWYFNLFTPKISEVILITSHTILWMLQSGIGSTYYLPVDLSLYSHHLSVWLLKGVKRLM